MKFIIEYDCIIGSCKKIIDASDAKEAEKILFTSEPNAKIQSVTPAEKE